jgi:hypothetical protein
VKVERDITINVSDTEIRELTALGFWKKDVDGVLVLTAEGNAWVQQWVSERIKRAANTT